MLLALVIALFTILVSAKKESPCQIEIAKIALQPKSLAYEYLEKAAHAVHSPKYRWFTEDLSNVAVEFYSDYFVGVDVTSATGFGLIYVSPNGQVDNFAGKGVALDYAYYSYDTMRTMGIGLPTHFRSDQWQTYYITQLVWSPYGELFIISVSLPYTDFLELK